MISFDYSWFLAKKLSNFVSLPWKLHNRYCHIMYTTCNELVVFLYWRLGLFSAPDISARDISARTFHHQNISAWRLFGSIGIPAHEHSGEFSAGEQGHFSMGTLRHWDIWAQEYFGKWTFWHWEISPPYKAIGHFGRHFGTCGEMCYCPEMFIFPKYLCAKMSLWRKVPVPKYPDAEISLCRRVHVPNSLLAKTPCRNVPGMKCPSGNVSCRNVRFWYKPKPTELVIQWTICCYIDARMSASKKDLPVTSL